MDANFIFFPLLSTLLFLFLIFFWVWKKSSNSTLNLPLTPWKLPIIGNMHHLLTSLPHHRLRDLANKYGPVMHLQLGEITTIVISSPQIVKEIMASPHDINFAQRPFMLALHSLMYDGADIVCAPYGSYLRHLRRICAQELLSPKRVQSFQSLREEEVSKMISHISCNLGSVVDLGRVVLHLIYTITASAALGKRSCNDVQDFASIIPEFMKVAAANGVADFFPSFKLLYKVSGRQYRVKKVRRKVDKILENVIIRHRAAAAERQSSTTTLPNIGSDTEAADDFVHVLLNLQDDRNLEFPLTTNTIKAIILDIFLAGTETSSTTLQWAMSELLRNPGVMEKAQAEVRQLFDGEGSLGKLQYLKLVVKETLRLHPPVPLLLPRECREACKIKGYDIPSKSNLIINAWALGRDPNFWTESEKFCPERFLNCDTSIDYKGTNFEYLPFGVGRRICPGVLFGILNVELPLASLLYHFDWRLPRQVQDLDMTEDFGLTVSRKNALCLVPIPYHPPQ